MPNKTGNADGGFTEAEAADPTIFSKTSTRTENIDDAIKRIKMLATERIRQKAAAARASLATCDTTGSTSSENLSTAFIFKENFSTIESLAASTSKLNLEPDDVDPNTAPHQIETSVYTSSKTDLGDIAGPPAAETAKESNDGTPKETLLISFDSDDQPKDALEEARTKDIITGGANKELSKPQEANAGVIVVPKPKPKAIPQKLPQTEDGFTPQPWIKRRYTIAQLLLLGQIMPYVICPRDRFNIHIFGYDLVHIPGLGNESSGNSIIDHQILSLNLRTELVAFHFFTAYGYRYLERFKDPNHTLQVKGLWVEVRGSAGLRDHGGYRNAYRPTPYEKLINQGLIKENQEAQIQALVAEHRNNHHPYANSNCNGYRGRGPRGGRGGSYRGGHRGNFVSASTQPPQWKEHRTLPLPPPGLGSNSDLGPPTPIVGNNIAKATAQETGTLHEISKKYGEIQAARTEIDQVTAGLENVAGHGEFVQLVEQTKERLAEKKAQLTNKWGEVYGYTIKEQTGELIKKPKGLEGDSSTQEQQMQYIKYMLQTPLAPMLDTTNVSGRLTPSIQLAHSANPGLHEDPHLGTK
ncbi:hypothetical protein TWF694_006745 [Orbilia ellipsospora]|uniref:Uncharacterized protein n=1 Tax=Orbilia ellipsospora TaxID=2528407 RepID=A0AAV9XNP3_9PEZI